MKHYLVTISHERDGQTGVLRMPKDYRVDCVSENTAAQRALALYKRECTKGRRRIHYRLRIDPL